MARVLDGVGARVVIASVDVVSRLEVTVVCIPSPWSVGVGSRWLQPCPSFVVPHVRVGCRANSSYSWQTRSKPVPEASG